MSHKPCRYYSHTGCDYHLQVSIIKGYSKYSGTHFAPKMPKVKFSLLKITRVNVLSCFLHLDSLIWRVGDIVINKL